MTRFDYASPAVGAELAEDFYGLFWQVTDAPHDRRPLFDHVLEPQLEPARRHLRTLESAALYRPDEPVADEVLWDLYALARVKDFLLLGLAPPPRHWRTTTENIERDVTRLVSLDQYVAFFSGIGLTVVERPAFSPIHHEIVSVVTDEAAPAITIESVAWPGLAFGELIFARAGVRVRASSRDLVTPIAEQSTLYDSYWRSYRPTEDLSRGWGHNSQWRTRLRRDYETASAHHFNVDGNWPVDAPADRSDPDLSTDERIELLIHRCFVRCDKRHDDRFPYDDRLTLAR
jgi:hypothetical protein